MLWLFLGIYATMVFLEYTPVYTDIECEWGMPEVANVRFEGAAKFDALVPATCSNPNPYDVVVTQNAAGLVYVGESRTVAGSIDEFPAATLPAGGRGTVEVYLGVSMSSDLFSSIPSLIFSGEIPVYCDVDLALSIDASFLFGRYNTEARFLKKCGMNFKVTFSLSVQTSMAACADNWEELVIPKVGASNVDTMGSGFGDEESHEVGEAARHKDMYLGSAMALAYGVSLLSTCAGVFSTCRAFRRLKSTPTDDIEIS